jgi:hypothetical protein
MVFFAAAFALWVAGCGGAGGISETSQSQQPVVGAGAALETWEAVYGSFAREGSSQYSNAVLSMMYLSNSCVMFEFQLTEGSEAENVTHDTVIPGVLLVAEDGTGLFESFPDAENPFAINFALSEDGQRVAVTHTGELEISPDGEYVFTDGSLEVSDLSAKEILEHLPTAATSLNSNLGAFTINYPDALISDWFYYVEAVFDDTGTPFAQFLIAKDMSAVFRVDDDIEPVLIFGSAQPMLDAEMYAYQEIDENDESGEPGGDEFVAEKNFEPYPVASVGLDGGVTIAVGSSSQLIALLPWELPYALTAGSSDESVAAVEENGVITAIAVGEATISGTLTVADGTKDYSIEISVTDSSLEIETPISDE